MWAKIRVWLCIVTILISVNPVTGFGQDVRIPPVRIQYETGTGNLSGMNTSALEKFQVTPEPVTVMHAGVSESALPGPRYMAFGPSAIDISVSPLILSALVVTGFLGVAAWCIRSGRSREEKRDP
jgi:hypothetical protein